MTNPKQLSSSTLADIDCVLRVASQMDQLRHAAQTSLLSTTIRERGYFLPSEEDEILANWGSYQYARSALYEVIGSMNSSSRKASEAVLAEFMVGYAAAALLVEAARFLRSFLSEEPAIRSKLNEAQPQFKIESGSFEKIQRSLTAPSNALQIRQARDFYENHESEFDELAEEIPSLKPIAEIIKRRRDVFAVSASRYVKSRIRDRSQQITKTLLHQGLMGAIYSIQQVGAIAIGSLSTSPMHRPQLPETIANAMQTFIQKGDILVTRKESALTNLFLPGFWPHAAFSIGNQRVVEALKDGVKNRSLESTFQNDAMIVVRPKLAEDKINSAVQRAISHVGKPYDFDFDFTRSDRMVCTEVVYRSFSGVDGIDFQLSKRAGRHTLSAEDLLTVAFEEMHFEIVAGYHPAATEFVLHGKDAKELVRRSIGKKQVDWGRMG
ncbi:YiiX/YebB-like N1pC/P60 family cysteine hydrolase [Rhodopirellula sp.]|jgi:hypothetical protein|nr:YiiX/YebB-like N1pC/P60 family cysteine hydrolase [Rhodopirellula sp.]